MGCRVRRARARWNLVGFFAASLSQADHATHLASAAAVASTDPQDIFDSKRQNTIDQARTSSSHPSGIHSTVDRGVSRSPLLDKYTYNETVKTIVDEDQLPPLPALLESIGLRSRLEDFYRKSVFETKYLFTLNKMDLKLMGLSPDEALIVQEKAKELRIDRDVIEERVHPLLMRRNELTYGRLFLERSASSFEFYLAGFGPPAPLDEARLVWAQPRNACGLLTNMNSLSGTFVLAERGQCSFLDKANTVASSNATVLVIVNNDGEDGEKLFRVAATLGGRSRGEEEPQGPQNMATVLVRGSTLPALSKAIEWGEVVARVIPLDCKPGKAACEAVLPEEREAEKQVDSGIISISHGMYNQDQFEFLSSSFGSTLPRGRIPLVPSVPEDACLPLENSTVADIHGCVGGAAVLVKRGGCSFGAKAKHVQTAGGRMIVVHDNTFSVLQNVGAPEPLVKELYIPGAFVTARAGAALVIAASALNVTDRNLSTHDGIVLQNSDATSAGTAQHLEVSFEPDNSVGRAWDALRATPWPEDMLEARLLARQMEATHAQSPCRSQWIKDKAHESSGGNLRSPASHDLLIAHDGSKSPSSPTESSPGMTETSTAMTGRITSENPVAGRLSIMDYVDGDSERGTEPRTLARPGRPAEL